MLETHGINGNSGINSQTNDFMRFSALFLFCGIMEKNKKWMSSSGSGIEGILCNASNFMTERHSLFFYFKSIECVI
jgi:hypothetical protein